MPICSAKAFWEIPWTLSCISKASRGDTAQVRLHIRERVDVFALGDFNDIERARISQKRQR